LHSRLWFRLRDVYDKALETDDGWDVASIQQQSLSHNKRLLKNHNLDNLDAYSQLMNQSVVGMNSIALMFEEDDLLMNVKGLKYSMEYLGHKQEEEECMKMLQLVDFDADGLINFDEFVVTAQNKVCVCV
jgi:hypothetical protein